MNFALGGNHSVILMSVRENAPHEDRIEDDGETLIYEGHDIHRTRNGPNPKTVVSGQRTATSRRRIDSIHTCVCFRCSPTVIADMDEGHVYCMLNQGVMN
jgi:hypothetical protein